LLLGYIGKCSAHVSPTAVDGGRRATVRSSRLLCSWAAKDRPADASNRTHHARGERRIAFEGAPHGYAMILEAR